MVLRVRVPDSCANLCPAKVERMLEKHFGNIYAAARELGVPGPDLRRLTWAQPTLLENALEERELVIQRALGVVIQAVYSDDPRRQHWGADKILSSWLARDHLLAPVRCGAAAPMSTGSVVFRWGAPAEPIQPPPEPPKLPAWPGPHPPPPLVIHLYQPWSPPKPAPQQRREPEDHPQPEPWRRMSRRGYR